MQREWQEEFEDSKGVINIRKLKKNRQHNGQKTEEQTTQWPKEKAQRDEQLSTKHTYKP
jgi:hypothetical protein